MGLLTRRPTKSTPFAPAPNEQAAERAYWFEALKEFYRTTYGLEMHPAQSNPSIVPPLGNVTQIQRPDKANPDTFFASGYRQALIYQQELLEFGALPNKMERILELGVGMGRLIVQFFPLNAALYGCDVTPDSVSWTRGKHGHRVNVELTNPNPPLPYPDATFDFVCANSVFTHVPCQLTDSWAAELRRIIRPGGFLIFTVLDANHYLSGMSYREFHQRFSAPGCRDWDRDAGVLMMTYHSAPFLRTTWGRYFRVLEIRQQYRDQAHVICRRED
jgi:SAM-dependent methyltransferase